MKMSIVFVVSDFDIGGITTSLRNLTDVLIQEGHRVGVVNLPGAKRLPVDFNPEIELIPLKGKALYWNLNMETIRAAKTWKRIILLPLAVLKRILNKGNGWQKFIFSNTRIEGYDMAVAFRQSALCYHFTGEHVIASRKIGFWHGDPQYMSGVEKWIDSLNSVDYVACVSKAVEKGMREMYPQYADKYKTVYNIFHAGEISEKSSEYEVDYRRDVINLVTVSRIEFAQKQSYFIPEIARWLKAKEIDFQWTVVGDGPDLPKLQNLINTLDVNDRVKCVGNIINPFPYMSKADVFVNTSLREAYGMVITEALILGIPCVAGEYPALKEIITDGENGIIAKNTALHIAEALEDLLTDNGKLYRLKQNVEKYEYSYIKTYHMFMELYQ